MQRRVFLALGIVCCLSAVAQAAFSISVGPHTFTVNTGLQDIPILVSSTISGAPVAGLDFRAQIGDGGVTLGGVDVGPTMTGVIDGVGMTFELNSTGLADSGTPPMEVNLGIVTVAGFNFVPLGLSLLGTLTIDTNGAPVGSWVLTMSSTADGATDFGATPIASENGTLTIEPEVIVPEPSSVVLGLFAVAGLGAVAIRKRRAA